MSLLLTCQQRHVPYVMLCNLEHRRDSHIDLFVENAQTIPRKMSEKYRKFGWSGEELLTVTPVCCGEYYSCMERLYMKVMVCIHIIRQNERVEPRSERRLSSYCPRPHAAAVQGIKVGGDERACGGVTQRQGRGRSLLRHDGNPQVCGMEPIPQATTRPHHFHHLHLHQDDKG